MQNIPAKKSLGQNWLKSKTALFKMVETGEICSTDIIVEVGPGKGALTENLLEKAGKVIAIEKDHRLIELLKDKFSKQITEDKLILLSKDVLDLIPEKFRLFGDSYKVIANIPYYITGQFLRKFLETEAQPERIIVMVQKEIADRIVAHDGKESLLSLAVKVYGQVKKVMKVDKENFSPAPKVDSAILAITNISKKFFTDNNIPEKKFFEILHAGFAHKRKMLLGNLKEWFIKKGRKDTETLPNIFAEIKLSEKIRAEDITLQNWADLTKNLH
jgi:16S rRNA (adenine1518-N6/adenine1519-N6)-dimethyltransferase